jgi:hypothetical protein
VPSPTGDVLDQLLGSEFAPVFPESPPGRQAPPVVPPGGGSNYPPMPAVGGGRIGSPLGFQVSAEAVLGSPPAPPMPPARTPVPQPPSPPPLQAEMPLPQGVPVPPPPGPFTSSSAAMATEILAAAPNVASGESTESSQSPMAEDVTILGKNRGFRFRLRR